MKKASVLFLVGITLFGLTGCQENTSETAATLHTAQTETSLEEETLLSPTVISYFETEEETTVNHTITSINPYIVTELTMVGDSYTLSFPQLEGSDEITCDFYNQLWLDMADRYASQAIADPSLSYTLSFQVMTHTDDLLSILFKGQRIYNDAAFPTNFYLTYNIDLKSGETVRLTDSSKLSAIAASLAHCTFTFPENYAYLAEFKDQVFSGHDTSKMATRLSSADYQVKLTKGGLMLVEDSNPTDFTYYEDGELRILTQVIHALGDYVVVIPTIE